MTVLNSVPRVNPEDTREDRALALYAGLGRFIEKIEEDLFLVPSSDAKGSYLVQYGGSSESCNCMDYQVHGHEGPCKHLLMLGIHHAARRLRPHTFECSGCGRREALRDAVVVHAEQAGLSAFFEGELVCEPCGRSEGVL